IDVERFARELAGAGDGLRDFNRGQVGGTERAETAGIGDRRDELGGRRPSGHRSLDDRVLDSELLEKSVPSHSDTLRYAAGAWGACRPTKRSGTSPIRRSGRRSTARARRSEKARSFRTRSRGASPASAATASP